ncbi:MAG: 50S ribosomal protein L4 [Candidatus Dormibacteraeota bacterium]|uniref:Large ribosomal subunit protein uL4 n=1 Tax=Candidatus Aeolococcus gillhamiae TaxID=3127015 RepID=A0A2W5Z6W8_9BACT|nr:50S ribosomal protein L4 [Candidatus Dormibacteraeota bacterium]PZR81120.1 MAG: 50S ribosomal protein L4 [Candidatus Dormibacter sp. RRmetagenome_bin12]
MTAVRVVDQTGAGNGELQLSDAIFGAPINTAVMHQALIRQLANARQGTHDTKTRTEVRGGGKKPWRQKGTGRARQGSIRSPQWTGGGIVFGPTPRSYRQDMPRKQRRMALRSALTAKAQDGQISVLSGFELETPSTRAVVDLLRAIEAGARVLVVLGSHNELLERSARNLAEVRVILAANLSVRDLLTAETVLMTRDAIEHVEEAWS